MAESKRKIFDLTSVEAGFLFLGLAILDTTGIGLLLSILYVWDIAAEEAAAAAPTPQPKAPEAAAKTAAKSIPAMKPALA